MDHFEFGWEAGTCGPLARLGSRICRPFCAFRDGTDGVAASAVSDDYWRGFHVFGIYSPVSGWVLLAINSLFGAATVPAIYEMAMRCFGGGEYPQPWRGIALWSAWIWALYPATMQYSVRWIWETSLTTFLVAWVLVVTLRLRGIAEIEHGTAGSEGGCGFASAYFGD